MPVIVKTCDDLRQEQCACQLIKAMHEILTDGPYLAANDMI
jgi:phosphatidylinositol kinase/protein kinase (PI-3  family)